MWKAASEIPYFSKDGENYDARVPLRRLQKKLPLRVLSQGDFEFWQTYGYVIVREAITRDEAARLLEFTWDFQGLDPKRPETWYPEKTFRSDLDQELYIYGMVEAYHHQLLWNSRQSQRVYDAFVDIWDCEELWVTLDRLNLNPPNRGNRDRASIKATDKGFDINLHWDIDTTSDPLPERVQGIISLTDCEPSLGGFQCSPELFRRFDEWKKGQPEDRDPIRPKIDRNEYPVELLPLKAGDLLIWNGLLAHGVARNTSESGIRSAQYLAMMPALESHEALRQSRIASWRDLATPDWNKTLLGDADKHESLRYQTAELNELGKKLLGLNHW